MCLDKPFKTSLLISVCCIDLGNQINQFSHLYDELNLSVGIFC